MFDHFLSARPPPEGLATPSANVGPMRRKEETDSSQLEPEVEAVLLVLNGALSVCRTSVKVSFYLLGAPPPGSELRLQTLQQT